MKIMKEFEKEYSAAFDSFQIPVTIPILSGFILYIIAYANWEGLVASAIISIMSLGYYYTFNHILALKFKTKNLEKLRCFLEKRYTKSGKTNYNKTSKRTESTRSA